MKPAFALVYKSFYAVLEDFNIHSCQESIRTSLVNRKIKVKNANIKVSSVIFCDKYKPHVVV